jgi:hypothetical protein
MKNLKNVNKKSVAITELELLDLEYVSGGVGSGNVVTLSGDCNGSGRSCETVRGIFDQVCKNLLK